MTQGQLIPWGGTFLTLAFLPISLCDDLRNLFLPLLSADAPSLTFYMKLNPISSSSPPPWRSRRSFCMYSAKATFACRRLRARPRARQRQTNWTRRKVVSGETFFMQKAKTQELKWRRGRVWQMSRSDSKYSPRCTHRGGISQSRSSPPRRCFPWADERTASLGAQFAHFAVVSSGNVFAI